MTWLREKQPIRFAVLWIAIYVIMVNVGDALSETAGVPNLITAPLIIALSIGLLLYLRKQGWLEEYGVTLPGVQYLRSAWYYLPLALIILVLVILGANNALGAAGTTLAVLLMLGVGFLEELVFRGFLFKAILKRSGVKRAVIISGVTFGIGHVVNLLRGYTGGEQLIQVVAGIALGIVLALLFALTGSILPGALFHIVLNIAGTLTQRSLLSDGLAVLMMLMICAIYGTHLWRTWRTRSESNHTTDSLRPTTA